MGTALILGRRTGHKLATLSTFKTSRRRFSGEVARLVHLEVGTRTDGSDTLLQAGRRFCHILSHVFVQDSKHNHTPPLDLKDVFSPTSPTSHTYNQAAWRIASSLDITTF